MAVKRQLSDAADHMTMTTWPNAILKASSDSSPAQVQDHIFRSIDLDSDLNELS